MKYVLFALVCLLVAQNAFAENDLEEFDLETRNLAREVLDMLQTRDSFLSCMTYTKKCSGHGYCKEDKRGKGDFICDCYDPWKGTKCDESVKSQNRSTLKDLLEQLRDI
ncbi:uncharacterized protein [Amphiura filiformis]|uniref:uncharacterized protein isoform X1 n=1 Tax=Amphiura filiformis TaxID=82378 RepID=UPI003B217336